MPFSPDAGAFLHLAKIAKKLWAFITPFQKRWLWQQTFQITQMGVIAFVKNLWIFGGFWITGGFLLIFFLISNNQGVSLNWQGRRISSFPPIFVLIVLSVSSRYSLFQLQICTCFVWISVAIHNNSVFPFTHCGQMVWQFFMWEP